MSTKKPAVKKVVKAVFKYPETLMISKIEDDDGTVPFYYGNTDLSDFDDSEEVAIYELKEIKKIKTTRELV